MQLPPVLRDAIAAEVQDMPQHPLVKAAAELSERYRTAEHAWPPPLMSDLHRLAYLITRFPATYAAAHAVLTEVQQCGLEVSVQSLLDLGAGPGAVAWAGCEVFPTLTQVTQVERDQPLIAMGQRLAEHATHAALASAQWVARTLDARSVLQPHDLVVLSYTLGELQVQSIPQVLQTAWQAARHLLVIIEPGTPHGFQTVLAARTALLASGAHLVAPCPHAQPCPLSSEDWCHFAQRVERTSLHRRVKASTLSYEDEKFAYVVCAKEPGLPAAARILRHPLIQKGHIHLDLCTPQGVQRRTVSRKHKAAFRLARKAMWGGAWDPEADD